MEKEKVRVIFHVDMNSFYASVEMAKHPELYGKPLAIADRVEDRRGIVVTSSYEARAQGVKTTMPVWKARKQCPQLIVKPPDFDLYRQASNQMFKLLRSYTEWVEKVSIDEGYMDVTELLAKNHPLGLACSIQERLLKELRLPSSIGIAPNKFLAKCASDMKKPMGRTILRKRDLPQRLWTLSIINMHGVGGKTAQKLNCLGIQTIGDLAQSPGRLIVDALGQYGEKLHQRANGIDPRPVDPKSGETFKSISQSTTFPMDIMTESEALPMLRELTEKVSQKLRQKKTVAYHVGIMIGILQPEEKMSVNHCNRL